MNSRITTIILGIAWAGSICFLLWSFPLHFPGNREGYEPLQPIAYSHRLHAGELGMRCLYCHFGAERSRHAGIPPAAVCLNCHRYVTAPWAEIRAEAEAATAEGRAPRLVVSEELQKLYAAVGFSPERPRGTPGEPQPLAWNKVHALPDFVFFDHRPHVAAGVVCQRCHGPVESMERVRQVEDLSMGWCVNCHRQVNAEGVNGRVVQASLDCAACHY